MVDLYAHKAGNGGQSQGTPTTRRAFLYSEEQDDRRARAALQTIRNAEIDLRV